MPQSQQNVIAETHQDHPDDHDRAAEQLADHRHLAEPDEGDENRDRRHRVSGQDDRAESGQQTLLSWFGFCCATQAPLGAASMVRTIPDTGTAVGVEGGCVSASDST